MYDSNILILQTVNLFTFNTLNHVSISSFVCPGSINTWAPINGNLKVVELSAGGIIPEFCAPETVFTVIMRIKNRMRTTI